MEENNKDIRKMYYEYYRALRTVEFMEGYDGWKSWQELREKIRRRRVRGITRVTSIAAAVLVFAVSVAYIHVTIIFRKPEIPVVMASSFPEMKSKKAILIFEDGESIDLTRLKGRIDDGDSKTEISNVDQQLTYKPAEMAEENVKYHTLEVPRGGEYQLVLSDGTKVWINSESSLHYPEVFGGTREITLNGEAYFEVAKDNSRPFIVHVGDNSIEVLGTHFNISAYEKDRIFTTLAEGKVKVAHGDQFVVLRPNEQAIIEPGVPTIEVKEVKVALYISWIKGSYEFRDTELGDIAAQLSRWYDVDFRFTDESLKDKRFAGIIHRDEELGFMLEIIERVAGVRFTRDKDVIYIDYPK